MNKQPSILQARKVDPGHHPGTEPIIFRIENKNIGSLQNFVGLTGLPKNGKGKFASGIVASALSRSEVFNIRMNLPEGRPRIGWFATDESQYDLYKTIQLVKNLSGSSIEKNLDVFNMRRDESGPICETISEYLALYKDCSLIVIDNIGDLLINYNDEGQSKKLITLLKQWSDIHNTLIVAVLHLGKGNNTTLGHLGAGLDRYAQSILRVEKDKERNVYTLTGNMLRSAAEFSPIDIMYDAGADQWKQTHHEDISTQKLKPLIARPSELDMHVHKATAGQIFNSQALQKYDLLLSNIKIHYAKGGTWAKECLNYLCTAGIIRNTDNGFSLAPHGQSKLFIQQ